VASEPSSPWHYGDQNSALYAHFASIRRATDWNHSSRVLGPYSVLDSCRPGIEACGVQGLLQSPSHSLQSRWQNTGRSSWRQCVRDAEVISMERTLSQIISDAHGGIITNSPCTSVLPFDPASVAFQPQPLATSFLDFRFAAAGWHALVRRGETRPRPHTVRHLQCLYI
jgi:hypothetical protein